MSIKKLDSWLKRTVADGKKIESGTENKNHLHKKKRHKPSRRPFHHGGGNDVIRIIPLGGVEEVGKNMTVIECGNDIIVVDMGFQFPEEDAFGVDYVIPDTSYLDDKMDRVRAVIITHGHLDHIGAVPYLFEKFEHVPFFGTKLTMGLVRKRLDEFKFGKRAKLNVVDPNDYLHFGKFGVTFFRVNHSIPDCVGVIMDTPQGAIVHTGDFKFDFSPADGVQADYAKLAALGSKKVVAMLSDSTNATVPGHTISESTVSETLDSIIQNAPDRVIIASFSSLIGRVQQILNSAMRNKRMVYVSGRSMMDNIEIATKLGYLKYPKGLVHDVKRLKNHKDHRALILTTGTQGEAVSSLTRMAMNDHAYIKIHKTDTVVLSSSPIVGNERAVIKTINNLTYLGATVVSHKIMDVHVSGHGNQEDLKMMINYVKPKYLVPVHGLLYMRKAHGKLASELGIPSENVMYVDNGSVVEIKDGKARVCNEKIESNYVIVDGNGVGEVGATVLKERQEMAENGMLMLMFRVDKNSKKLLYSPTVISKGFLYRTETEHIEKDIIEQSKQAYEALLEKDPGASWDDIKNYIGGRISRFTHKTLDRSPLILPIIVTL